MIRVTVEVVPYGNEHAKEVIGVAEIANLGRITKGGYCAYEMNLKDQTGCKHSHVKRFLRERGVWDLIMVALRDRNK